MTQTAERFTVAIDGPAAAGKGTISRALAERYGFAHLDTGLLYRATGMKALAAAGPDFTEGDAAYAARSLTALDLEADGLRSRAAGVAASRVAAVPAVRDALLDFQRDFARRKGGAILDGRDIGTVICPEAEAKLYVTANDDIRATRRFKELSETGHDVSYESVLADLRERDARDSARAAAPLKPAEDAVILDTSQMSINEAVAQAIAHIEAKRG